jgi:uncharacterized protein YndB with AHSA1/START domain
MTASKIGDIVVEQIYPYPVERVWLALTDSRALADWLMQNDFKPVVGHKFQFRSQPQGNWNGLVDCEVIEVNEPRSLAYTWKGGTLAKPTTVRYTLEPAEGGTRVRLEHTGFEGPDGMMLSEMLSNGWKTKIMTGSFPAAIARVDDAGYHPAK